MKKTQVILLTMALTAAAIIPGCGKKDETSESNAVALTPTVTATVTPTVTANVSGSTTSTSSTTPTSSTSGSTEIVAPSTELTGTVISATMNDLVLRTSDNKEYPCSTLNATKNLSHGVTIGATMTVTLESTESQGGYFKATKLSDNESSSGIKSNNNNNNNNSNDSSSSESYSSSGYDSDSDSGYDSGYSSDSDSGYDSGSDSDSDSDSGYDSDSDS